MNSKTPLALAIVSIFATVSVLGNDPCCPPPPTEDYAFVEIIEFGTNPATGQPSVKVYNEVGWQAPPQDVFIEIWAWDENGNWGYGSSSHGSIPGAKTNAVASVSGTHPNTHPQFDKTKVVWIEAYAVTEDPWGWIYDEDWDFWY